MQRFLACEQYDIHGEDGSVAELNSINVEVRVVTALKKTVNE
jgi:hypothetical protein